MTSKGSLSIALVQPLNDILESRGFNSRDIYSRFNLDSELLLDNSNRISVGDLDRVFGYIKSECGIKSIGLELAEKFELRTYGLIGYLLDTCSSLGEALLLGREHFSILSDSPPYEVRKGKRFTEIELFFMEGLEEGYRSRVELCMHGIGTIGARLTDEPIDLEEAHFKFSEPDNLDDYYKYFDSKLLFNSDKYLLVYRNEIFGYRPKYSNTALNSKFMLDAASLTLELQKERRLVDDLRLYFSGTPVVDWASKEEVANKYYMSQATLTRRLSEAGETLSSLMLEAKRKQARVLLESSALSISEIAYQLGYTSRSAFDRAFKVWFKCSPCKFRK